MMKFRGISGNFKHPVHSACSRLKPMTLILCSSLQSFPSAYRLRSFLMIFRYAALVLLAAFLTSVSASAQTSILTQHYDTERKGQKKNGGQFLIKTKERIKN